MNRLGGGAGGTRRRVPRGHDVDSGAHVLLALSPRFKNDRARLECVDWSRGWQWRGRKILGGLGLEVVVHVYE